MRKNALQRLQVQVSPDRLIINGYPVSLPVITFIEEIQPRGSNSLVFKTKDSILNRLVAVKIWIPRQGVLRNRQLQGIAEASKLAQFSHANIAQIYHCGKFDNGFVYSVMEFLEGLNLDDFLQTHNPDFGQRWGLWSQINEALLYAYSKDIYHGDLHPGNIRVVHNDVKLFDFGTSLFNGKTYEISRESRLINETAKILFPNDQPKLTEITDVDLYSLKPSLILQVISAWLMVVRMFEEIKTVLEETDNSGRMDNVLRYRMSSLAFDVSSAPIFSLQMIQTKLNNIGVSSYSQDVFLGFCTAAAEMRLDDSRRSFSPERTMPEVEETLKIIWPKLLALFLARGPFDTGLVKD